MSFNPDFERIAAIHATPYRGCFVITGGGSAVLSELLQVPNASRTVLEAVIPYDSDSMSAYLGRTPEHACSEETARSLAAMAWKRACLYAKTGDPELFGFALTATLATSRPHRGEHRAFLAVMTRNRTVSFDLHLEKEAFSREEEEQIVRDWALRILDEICEVRISHLAPTSDVRPPESWQRILTGESPFVLISRNPQTGAWDTSTELSSSVRGIFPGSFHPFHAGHAGILRLAAQRLGGSVVPELSVLNADKPPLDYAEIETRLRSIFDFPEVPTNSVLLTGLPFFEGKSAQFPNRTFIVGADTLARIGNVKYHHGEPLLLRRSHEALARSGCRFLVFGRVSEKEFQSGDASDLPDSLRILCDFVPESDFRCDVSSTQLRVARG